MRPDRGLTRVERKVALGVTGVLIAIGVIGCGETSPPESPGETTSRLASVALPLGDVASRRYDFGAVIGKTGLTKTHIYTITNRSDRPVTLRRAINMKSCCGDIKPLAATTLAPGQATTLEVTIRVGQTLGPLSHYVVVETDHPEAARLEFWTLAEVHPRVRFEESAGLASRQFPNETVRRRLTAFAYGTKDEPPIALDEGNLKSVLPVAWDGAASERALPGGLTERSRPFTVTLPASPIPGPRAEEVRLAANDETLLTHLLNWEVVPAVKASPNGIVVASDASSHEGQVLLRSQDGRDFRVTGVESSLPGLKVEVSDTELGPMHKVRLHVDRTSENAGRSGKATIQTDHPAQPNVEVVVFILGVAPVASTGESKP